jgi:hemerythrin-like domain-containing protein
MLVNLGDKPLAGFGEPIELMKDCHRRIEYFLDVLRRVESQYGAGELADDARRAIEGALNYFANFAPRHTADEEESLFPRLRSEESAEVSEAMAALDQLESDHRQGEANHALVDRLARLWLATGRLDSARRARLRKALDELAMMYDAHIRLEEGQVFVLASRLLKSDQLHEIGEEMKRRRSLVAADAPG